MNLNAAVQKTEYYTSSSQKSTDPYLDTSNQRNSKTHAGTAEVKNGDIKTTLDSDSPQTVAVSGAPSIAAAMNLLKILSDIQDKTPKVPYTGAALYKYDTH